MNSLDLLVSTLAQADSPAQAEAAYHISAGGWLMMIVSIALVTGLLGWCIYKVVATPGETEHLHSPADIKTPDVED